MYHRGRRPKGVWVFGANQRKAPEIPIRALLIPVPNRTSETSFSIIQRWIKPGIPHTLHLGTEVISDGWASYMVSDQMGYLHLIEIGSMPDTICLKREQENGYMEVIIWNISIASNSIKVLSTKSLEDF
ncbi:hypothetical protein RF11_03330 [Thelohanellus kitauei]|uniref:ISXO2-like transposase domain-containing protein n=1 Tax=Thelohanellus kitauei TaxID=669202 RepID=A0A0C2MCI1_THEKT|nr:hypothetical protein RF11_03330 [Thelohanellus kitauei]